MFDKMTKNWTSGPRMKEKRYSHTCIYDKEANVLFVIGGLDVGTDGETEIRSATVERLNLENNITVWENTPSIPEPIANTAAVISKSSDLIGIVAGGMANYGKSFKVWGLRRRDLGWDEMTRLLQGHSHHPMVNVASDEIPGC